MARETASERRVGIEETVKFDYSAMMAKYYRAATYKASFQ